MEKSKVYYDDERERIEYDQTGKKPFGHLVLNIHLHSYAFAHQYVWGKTVLDAACGTCLGSMLFSMGAKRIIAVDRNREAIAKGRMLKYFCPIKFMVKDLEKDILPEADVCISLETIEHLTNGFFLENLKVKHLVFSVPLDGGVSKFHRVNFEKSEDVVDHFRKSGWEIKVGTETKRTVPALTPSGEVLLQIRSAMGMAERR